MQVPRDLWVATGGLPVAARTDAIARAFRSLIPDPENCICGGAPVLGIGPKNVTIAASHLFITCQ